MATVDPGGPMMRRLRTALLAVLFLVPALPAVAVTRPSPPRLPPNAVSPLPSYVRRVEPAVVGLRVKARADAPSSQRLGARRATMARSEEHTSELQSPCNLVCRLLLEKKKND